MLRSRKSRIASGLALLCALAAASDASLAQDESRQTTTAGSFRSGSLDPNSTCPDVVLAVTFRQGMIIADWKGFSPKMEHRSAGTRDGGFDATFVQASCTFTVQVRRNGG